MTLEAQWLLALLGRLPDGVAHGDTDALLPEEGPGAQRKLVQVGLAYEEGKRLRALAPVREYVRDHLPPREEDLARAMAHYGELATTLGPQAGGERGANTIALLALEMGNLESMIREGLRRGKDAAYWIDAAVALAEYVRISGRGDPSLLDVAMGAARATDDVRREALCLRFLGRIAHQRTRLDDARKHLQQALILCQRISDKVGETDCFHYLGHVELDRSNHEQALSYFTLALDGYRMYGVKLGEGNCVEDIGTIQFRRAQFEEARKCLEEAISIYTHEDVASQIGQGSCLQLLGDIELELGNLGVAETRYALALKLSAQTGSVLNQADATYAIGELARRRGKLDSAWDHFEKAMPKYQQVGSLSGEGNCRRGLGEIARERSAKEMAQRYFEDALDIYGRIPDPWSMGMTCRCLARLTTDPVERQRQVEAARMHWAQIGRSDLVSELDEFDTAG